MVQKLKLNPNICYILGIYETSDKNFINLRTSNDDLATKFTKLIITDLTIKPEKIITEKHGNMNTVILYNSKLKKLFDKTLERKSFVFKYLNAYAANYFAAIFDYNGGKDEKGLYITHLNYEDSIILEKLNIHTNGKGRSYIINPNLFIMLIKDYSLKLVHIIH